MQIPVQRRSKLATAAVLAVALALVLTSCGSKSAAPPATTTTAATTAPATTTETAPPPTTSTAPSTATTTPSTGKLSPAAKLILQLAKAPKKASLPKSLQGSSTQATALAPGSRKQHAAGAIVTTNGGALAGFLVFKTHGDALADLKAYPPNSGPNKIIARSVPGLPKPTYVLSAIENGYVARYVVFVDGTVIVNTWAYGQAGKAREKKLLAIVEQNAHWAQSRLAAARKAA
jgi:hypothetical protein